MKKLNKNETGFGTLELILILIVFVLLGVVGWMVYRNNQSKSAASNTTLTTTKSADNSVSKTNSSTTPMTSSPTVKTNTFKVPELSVRIVNVPTGLSDLNYAVNVYGEEAGSTFAYFSTSSLSKLDDKCSPTGKVSQIGALTKVNGTYDPNNLSEGGGTFVKQFNGYWISYSHPQAACSDNATTEAIHTSQTSDFQKLVSDPANIQAL